MENYEPITSSGEEVAEIYDALSPREDTAATVAFLEHLAGGGPVLELAIGTGQVALSLAARGVRVDGIDRSPASSCAALMSSTHKMNVHAMRPSDRKDAIRQGSRRTGP